MFNFLKPKKTNKNLETITLKLSGLHCTSCATNIDLTLEDLPGVVSSNTSYAKSELKVSFDPSQIKTDKIRSSISKLGYTTA